MGAISCAALQTQRSCVPSQWRLCIPGVCVEKVHRARYFGHEAELHPRNEAGIHLHTYHAGAPEEDELSLMGQWLGEMRHDTSIPRRNSMLLLVFLSLLNIRSIASTGGTPVNARRRRTTRLPSSGW